MNDALRALGVLAAMAVSMPAHAGWEYTRWDMSARDAVAASDRRLRLVDIPSDDVIPWRVAAIGWHRIGDDDFDVSVREHKATARIERIELRSEDEAACTRASAILVPADASAERGKWERRPSHAWTDESAGNDVRFLDRSTSRRISLFLAPEACVIIYRPLTAADSGSG